MKNRLLHVLPLVALAGFAAPQLHAHEVPNMEHTHAFEQSGYGKYREGHYVNGPQGSIIIWSHRTHSGYQGGSQVRFARPVPISKAPGSPQKESRAESDPSIKYGKK